MKQQINLFPREEKPEVIPSSKHILMASAGFFILLIIMTLFSVIGLFQDVNQLKKMEEEEVSLKQKLAVLEKKIPSPKIKEDLERQIKYLEDMRNSSEEVLSVISKLQSDKFMGFSEYLKGLSEQTVPGLWLTHFSFQSEGTSMTLKGIALRPELIPRLIENLGNVKIYGGKTFQIFKMALDPKTAQINFILSPEQVGTK